MAKIISAGTGFETESERITAQLLEQLPGSWFVVANKFLVMGHGKSFEIDFIIVADHRIIVLDDKFWRGRITGSTDYWTMHASGEARRSPFNQVQRNALNVMAFLGNKGIKIPYQTVQPIIPAIILTHPDCSATINDPRAKHCLMNRTNAIEKIEWLDKEGERAGLNVIPFWEGIRKALYDQDDAHRPKVPKKIHFFQIEERLEDREHCRVFAVTHEEDNTKRTLYVYNALDNQTNHQLDHELSALKKLQQTGLVPIVESSFLWGEDEVKVVPVRPPAGDAWGALPRPTSEDEVVRLISIAATAFDGLGELHRAGVIHRGIDPSKVIVKNHGIDSSSTPSVTFTDFVFARVAGQETIAPKLDAGGFNDLYASPQIDHMKSYGFADESSDVYSLGLVVLETLMGVGAREIARNVQETRHLPEIADAWPYISDAFAGELGSVFESALTAGSFAGKDMITPTTVAEQLRHVASRISAGRQQVRKEAGEVDGHLEVVRLLGEGAFARTFLVYDRQNDLYIAAKRYTHRDYLDKYREQIVREFRTLWLNQHEHLPKPYRPAEPDNPHFQLFMEYIPGETLRARIRDVANDRDRWANVMRGLLAAVEHLETHGILHRDIKPENVLLRDDNGRVVLIDLGAAISVGQRASLAGAPGYWPPEWKDQLELPPGTDRYAAAVTLFEALTGQSPFRPDSVGFVQELRDSLPSTLPNELHAVANALLRAMSADPAVRPATTPQLRDELEQALRAIAPLSTDPDRPSEQLVAWVSNLRGLFRNSRIGNADNRGLDSNFAKETYVETALDTSLWPAIRQRRPAIVFLSGNPGDGKTAFLEHVRDDLIARGAVPEVTPDPSGWELEYEGHSYRACFDASESVENRSATEQLVYRLRGLEGESPAQGITVLVAINDGRLREVSEELDEIESHPWLLETLEEAKSQVTAAEIVRRRIWVIDLKRRAYVSLELSSAAPSVMRQMLATMVDATGWAGARTIAPRFPPAANAIALQANEPGCPAERLEYLLTLAHLRGDRHTTVRDLRSALALMITSDLGYDEHRSAGETPSEHPWTHRYWNIAFTTDQSRDLVLGELRWLDPARFAHPELERFLFFHHRPEDAPKRARLFANGIDEPPPAGDDASLLRAWISAVKRRLVFEGVSRVRDPITVDPLELLPYTSASAMIDLLTGRSDGEELKRKILIGIGRSDQLLAATGATDLMLRVKKSEEHQIELVKTLSTSDFVLQVERLGSDDDLIEMMPRTITLRHTPTSIRVQLNLDVVEILTRLADGLAPQSKELEPLLDELLPFKSRLQGATSDRLLVREGSRQHLIVKQGERIVRQNAQLLG